MNDKKIVEATQSSFDVVVLQANLAVSATKGLSSWLGLDKPFWIDPITYAFVANPNYLMSEQKVKRGEDETRWDFKRTFRVLAERYGEPFTRLTAERRSLRPDDFDPTKDAEVVQRLTEWQLTVLEPSDADRRYLPLARLEPVLVTAPFFPLRRARSGEPEWLEVNLRLARETLEQHPSERVAVGVLVEESLFDDPTAFNKIFASYMGLGAQHLWLWLDENEEESITEPRARRLREYVRTAVASGVRVHQAFAGSYSALLLSEGLSSIGYGVAYWEHKGWEPLAGGGLPSLRFFYPPLGQRLRFLDADAVNDAVVEDAAEFHQRVCDCETCVSTLKGDLANFALYGLVEVRSRTDRRGHRVEYDVPIPDALRRSKEHYVRSRGREARRFSEAGFDAVAHLEEVLNEFTAQQVIDTRYLTVWRDALSD